MLRRRLLFDICPKKVLKYLLILGDQEEIREKRE